MSECVKCGALAIAGKPTCAQHAPDSDRIEGIDRVRPPLPQPCAMCPWRVANQIGEPPKHEGSYPWYYTETTRRAMWTNWGPNGESLGAGNSMFCHPTGPMDDEGRIIGERVHECTGCAALQQRALIRAVHARELVPPLRGIAARAIAARMLGVDLDELRGWRLHGGQITGDDLVRVAHPGVFSPALASEQVPPPTADELERWTAIRGAPVAND